MLRDIKGIEGLRNSGIKELWDLGIQGFRDSGIKELWDLGIQGFRDSGILFFSILYEVIDKGLS
ncbi:MAG: hypothetical protein KJP05_01935, partial [Deltaproteobacteria bacterium]|nr:hypothetical protein [Deltaproteobacteria bacterium]